MKKEFLGNFLLRSGQRLTVSDPCYNGDVWCRRDMKNKGIIDFQISPSIPITYKINFPLIEKEYGYSPFVEDVDFYDFLRENPPF